MRREAWGFAVGSLFFAVGALPGHAQAVGATWGALTFVGTILFNISTAAVLLAAVTGSDTPAAGWRPGSVFFAVSAVGAFVVPSTQTLLDATAANAGTLAGASCFLVAALLSRRASPSGKE